jgi:hypothetical protein
VKTLNRNPKAKLAATSLVLVLVVSAASIVLVGGIMNWISTNTDLTLRINRFRSTTAAGGAATEKVIGQILSDFQIGGMTAVSNNLSSYTTIVPSDQDLLGRVSGVLNPITGILEPAPAPDSTTEWAGYEFSDGQGNSKKSRVAPVSPWSYSQLTSAFSGLNAYTTTFRLVSNVQETEHKQKSLAGVQQEVVLASIPVFGFNVFYAPELEICPSTAMTLGRIHANKNIYLQPASTLTLAGPVTTSQRIIHDKHPADPSSRTPGQIISQGDREGGANTLLPALGTNRSLADFRKIIEMPPSTESRTSALGRQRLYNKADLIIKITSTGFVAHSGAYNSFATTIPWTQLGEIVEITGGKGKGGNIRVLVKKPKKPKPSDSVTNIYDGVVSTNVTFYNARGNINIRCTEIDVAQLIAKSNYLFSVLGRPVRTLYVADTRTSTTVQSGVRVIFGETLPATGLTIVTPNPLYIVGNYNVPTTLLGTTNTSKSVPAALIGDAITILSEEWTDTDGALDLSYRRATNTTINAALLGGIVPTRGGYYSGGLENFPRLLEDWSGRTLTINGSFVVLFESAVATAPWGARDGIYALPVRKWSFDPRLNTVAGLPPSTPELRTAFRRSWQNIVVSR